MRIKRLNFIRGENFLERIVKRPLFWIIFTILGFSIPIVKTINRDLPRSLPYLYKISDYSLINSYGDSYGSKDLRGRVYVINFIFTSCGSICPNLMKKTQVVQKRLRGLGSRVAIITVTVDPENDTVGVLNKYSKKYRANPRVWKFLTGKKSKINNLILNELKLPVSEDTGSNDVMDIVHSERFVLVGQEGHVRGYYSIAKEDLNRMMIDIGLMVNRVNKDFVYNKKINSL
jgi:protein SCO1/2